MRIGVDLGGTKVAAIVLDRAGACVWEAREATPRNDYSATVELIASLVAAGERAAGATCTVGIGTPGAVSPATGLMKNANSTWLNGRPLRTDLERTVGREVRLSNDANCLAMSEVADGEAVGARVVFGVILGTGVGGGLVVDGRVVDGANAIAGEWGHNPLPWPDDGERPGPSCYCGRAACIETFLSGPGLAADHARAGGGTRTAREIVALAAGGDAGAVASLDRWCGRLARALATVINVIDPEVIVVGGGLSRVSRLFDDVPHQWIQWVFSDAINTRLVPARHGDASGARGAACLWP